MGRISKWIFLFLFLNKRFLGYCIYLLDSSTTQCSKMDHLKWMGAEHLSFSWNKPFEIKWWICFLQAHSFSLHINWFIDGLELLLWCYCDGFISCLDSHSDGTHSLQRVHWWSSDVMLNFSKSVPMKKQTHLYLVWPEDEVFYCKIT